MVVDDPDAPGGNFTHWITYDIPPTTNDQGRNDFGKTGSGGPYPPPGKPHGYFFRLHAVDEMLQLRARDARTRVGAREWMGRSGR